MPDGNSAIQLTSNSERIVVLKIGNQFLHVWSQQLRQVVAKCWIKMEPMVHHMRHPLGQGYQEDDHGCYIQTLCFCLTWSAAFEIEGGGMVT